MKDRLGIQAGHEGAVWQSRERMRYPRKAAWYRHTHEELEASLVISGHADYVINGSRQRIGRGCLVWLFPQQEHQMLDLSADFRHIIAVWRPLAVRRVARDLAQPTLALADPPGVWIRQLSADHAQPLAEVLADVAQQTNVVTVNSGLRYLLQRLWEAFHNTPAHTHDSTVLATVLDGLRDEAHSIAGLARRVGLSPDHLRRLVVAATGDTPVQLRQRYALERFFALRRSDESLLISALAAGFGSYAQFHRVFKRMVGHAPQQWLRDLAVGQAKSHPVLGLHG